jgi:hypothetical protein
MGGQLATKRLGLLHELVPDANRVAALLADAANNVAGVSSDAIGELKSAGNAISLEIEIFDCEDKPRHRCQL